MGKGFSWSADGPNGVERLLRQVTCPPPAFFDAEQAWIRQFAPGSIFVYPLASVGGVALYVEQVVCDLEHQSEAAPVGIETPEHRAIRSFGALGLGAPNTQRQASAKQCPRLVLMNFLKGLERARLIAVR